MIRRIDLFLKQRAKNIDVTSVSKCSVLFYTSLVKKSWARVVKEFRIIEFCSVFPCLSVFRARLSSPPKLACINKVTVADACNATLSSLQAPISLIIFQWTSWCCLKGNEREWNTEKAKERENITVTKSYFANWFNNWNLNKKLFFFLSKNYQNSKKNIIIHII